MNTCCNNCDLTDGLGEYHRWKLKAFPWESEIVRWYLHVRHHCTLDIVMESSCKLLHCKQIWGHVLYISCTVYFSPFTRAADNPHRSIFATTRKKFQPITRTQKQKKIVDSHKVPSLFLLTWYPIACTCTLFVFAVSLRMIPLVKICSKKNRYLEIYWVEEIAWNDKILGKISAQPRPKFIINYAALRN